MAEERVPFSELLAGYGTSTIGPGMDVESVFALLKLRSEDATPAWSVRSGGVPIAKEELLGVLDGLTTSIRGKLTERWKGRAPQPPAASTGEQAPPSPIPFSELLAGLDTLSVDDKYLIESVFAVIKARRIDRAPIWYVRSSEMRLSFEELLGALDGYAATVRDHLAGSWAW